MALEGCFAAGAVGRDRAVTSRSVSSSGHPRDNDPLRPDGRFQMYSRRREHAAAELHLERPLLPIANWFSRPATAV